MKYFFIVLFYLYKTIKPIIHMMNISVFGYTSLCRHRVSCSDYAIQQLKKHGTITGLKLAVRRFASCHPYAID